MKRISVTLDFTIADEDLPQLREAGWIAAQGQFADRAEWDEYRSDGSFGRQPYEYDLVEIVLSHLWFANSPLQDLTFLELEDTHIISSEVEP